MFYRLNNEHKVIDYSDKQYFSDCQYTDLISQLEYEKHPNKVVVAQVEKEIEVPDYDEEGNPIIIEYEDTEVVIDYDEEGNPIGSHEIVVIKHKQQTHTEIIEVYELILNPNYEQEEAEKREATFEREFFNTSLGYVRRKVTMKDGSHKDFLSDLLPIISMGVQSGTSVTILAYDKPDFTQEVIDWEEYQHQVTVTPAFIQECFLQLQADFK